jgi:hypothetical protein
MRWIANHRWQALRSGVPQRLIRKTFMRASICGCYSRINCPACQYNAALAKGG